jgi:hypothetical protein
MGTRATFHPSVEPAALPKRVPSRYRSLLDASVLSGAPVDVLVFETGSGHVVTMKDLARALPGGRSCPSLLAFGYDFTEEVRSEIAALGGTVLAEHNVWGWTEESWRAVRTK